MRYVQPKSFTSFMTPFQRQRLQGSWIQTLDANLIGQRWSSWWDTFGMRDWSVSMIGRSRQSCWPKNKAFGESKLALAVFFQVENALSKSEGLHFFISWEMEHIVTSVCPFDLGLYSEVNSWEIPKSWQNFQNLEWNWGLPSVLIARGYPNIRKMEWTLLMTDGYSFMKRVPIPRDRSGNTS